MTNGDGRRVRVMVVDGDAVYRQAFARALAEHARIEVVATAINARTALPKAESYRPDVITVDMVNAEVDGLQLLEQMKQHAVPGVVLLMVGEGCTLPQALQRAGELGFKDQLARGCAGGSPESAAAMARELTSRVLVLGKAERDAAPAAPAAATPRPAPPPVVAAPPARPPAEPARSAARPPIPAPATPAPVAARRPRRGAEVVGIGISTGGPKALAVLLPMLPADFPLPILIVQHMPAHFTASLAESLGRVCRLPVREARAGELVVPRTVLIAPGGRHMKVMRADEGVVIRLTDEAPENSCRPAVDVLFRSLGQVYGANTIAMIMTGMGEDGFAGCKQLHAAGATIIAQDEASCTVFGMPRGPVESGIADVVAPLPDLATRLCEAATGGLRCN
ncbi:MAG: chemotaxis-specific protein-glutamate methyltransferase CheB [Planctomycetes bacterium]|nr:chemotaxis-specific protein-glutamate methyltransferase CheB [Planctomycetota bacterium]